MTYEKVRKTLIHGFWLRFILESYLDFLINLFLHVRSLSF